MLTERLVFPLDRVASSNKEYLSDSKASRYRTHNPFWQSFPFGSALLPCLVAFSAHFTSDLLEDVPVSIQTAWKFPSLYTNLIGKKSSRVLLQLISFIPR